MINYLSKLLRNKQFERHVTSDLNFLENRVQNLNERIRMLECTVASQANTIASLTKSSGPTPRPDPFPDKNIAHGKLPKKKTEAAGVSGYRSGTGTSRHSASYADDAADSHRFVGDANHVHEDSGAAIRHHGSSHHHHGSDHCHNSFGDIRGYDSGCSDSTSSSGSFD
ncbi:hypothetical protein NUKP99_46990 [Klebsiella variicola]|nr:hypothetical protein NUKP99_46990 [Klebsiella variicola]